MLVPVCICICLYLYLFLFVSVYARIAALHKWDVSVCVWVGWESSQLLLSLADMSQCSVCMRWGWGVEHIVFDKQCWCICICIFTRYCSCVRGWLEVRAGGCLTPVGGVALTQLRLAGASSWHAGDKQVCNGLCTHWKQFQTHDEVIGKVHRHDKKLINEQACKPWSAIWKLRPTNLMV